jgi:hypothetical protein
MNERIQQLKEQATTRVDAVLNESMAYTYFDTEKFAELIVAECEQSIKSVPTHFEAQDKIIVECLKVIRETFRS